MHESGIECNQNEGCDWNMNLQAATKFDSGMDCTTSDVFSKCWNGDHRQNGGLKAPNRCDNTVQSTTFSKA